MRFERSVTGTIVDSDGRAVAGAEVHATAGAARLDAVSTDEHGAFTIKLPSARPVSVTVFSREHLAWRSPVAADSNDVDLGQIQLSLSEHAAGIAGQAWNIEDDCPAQVGRVSLRRGGDVVVTLDVENDGGFFFALAQSRLLPAGSYRVLVTAPGFAPASVDVELVDDVTLYLLGRVNLHRRRARLPS